MSKRRKKVKKKNRKIVWIIESLLFIILISLLVLLKIFNPQEREKIEEKSEETVKPLVIQTQQRKLDLDQLHSSAGIVISLDDSKVIFQFQQDEKIFPASLTKIMTCILAIENINNLEASSVFLRKERRSIQIKRKKIMDYRNSLKKVIYLIF